jgi:hypothetical protein
LKYIPFDKGANFDSTSVRPVYPVPSGLHIENTETWMDYEGPTEVTGDTK